MNAAGRPTGPNEDSPRGDEAVGHLQEPLEGTIALKNYIDGRWVQGQSREQCEVRNPATQKTIALAQMSSAEDVNEAVAAASRAFPEWSQMTPLARTRCLFELRELLEQNFEDLSRVQTMEHGKTIDESRGETRRGIENIEVAAGMPSLMMGKSLEDVASGIDERVQNQPVGVFGCIAPYNFPFMVPLWYVPYALALGNTFVLKPSPRAPISQVRLCELMEEAGFPPGVFNLVHGGASTAEAMLDHPEIAGVSFVGSTPVARHVYKKCGETGKRVIAQGGAKNFIVVMPDANLDRTIPALLTSFFGNTGQRCLAGANAVVVGKDRGFYKELVSSFAEAAGALRLGYGLDESVQMGPLQAEDRKEVVLKYIETGLAEGGKLRCDGRAPSVVGDYPENCFIGASVFEGVRPDMRIAREEIFGPVASVMQVDDLAGALEVIDENPFGNSASIFTCNGGIARRFRQAVSCGNVGINIGIPAPMAFFPFGGMKDSFFGVLHGQGRDAIRFFCESKVVIERWF